MRRICCGWRLAWMSISPTPWLTPWSRPRGERGLGHEEVHSQVEYIVAHGIVSEVNGRKVIIGSAHFVFEDAHCAIPEGEQGYDSLPDQYSHLYLAVGGVLSAVVCISDPLRPEAGDVIRQLRGLGIPASRHAHRGQWAAADAAVSGKHPTE